MNTCIKCGREIPDGELFCRECALNPGAISEDGSLFGKALIFVALGEGIALYGLLVSILILAKI